MIFINQSIATKTVTHLKMPICTVRAINKKFKPTRGGNKGNV